ncbi:methyl-accepting chemotaxis protein [Ammoniphilus sp. CFH 90114]|nr:methyl-accepting chemotaxis protein [Ammoniphilus sp. CFH 90114]
MRISRKLLIVFSAICLIMGSVGYVGLYYLSESNSQLRSMYHERFLPVIQLMEVNKAFSENTVILMNAASIRQSAEALNTSIAKNLEIAKESIEAYSLLDLTKEEQNLLSSLQTLMIAYESNTLQTIDIAASGDQAALAMRLNGSSSQKKALEDTINALVEIQSKKSGELYELSDQQYVEARTIILAMVFGGIILAILFGTILTRIIVSPINQVKNRLQEMSNSGGDLTQRIKVTTNDEVGQLAREFNSMLDSIRNIIQEVLHHAKLVTATSNDLTERAVQTSQASEQIATAVKQIASGADTQVQSITETSVSMNQMSAGVQQIAANSLEVAATAKYTTQIAHTGRETIGHSMEKIETVTTTVVQSADMMKILGERSQSIGQIVDVITGIASQTNLLSLNAAIEAARAGEQGRGFAVVANEVRKLATESALAAQQISEMIKEIQTETTKVAEYMVKGTSEVQLGLAAAKEASNSFQQIHEAIGVVTKQITEVSAATEQMVAGTEDVLYSIQTIVNVAESATDETGKVHHSAEESRTLMNQIVSSASSMTAIAQDLQKLVGQFKV